MNREMFDAVQPYLVTAQDVGGGHGAQGEPATGPPRPVETPALHPDVGPGVPAPPLRVGAGDAAGPPSPGSTNDVGELRSHSRPRPSEPSGPTTNVTSARSDRLGDEGGGEVPRQTVAQSAASTHLPAIARQEIDRVRQRASLTSLHKALGLLVTDADRLAENGDLVDLAAGLAQLRAFRQATADVERHIEDHVADLMWAPELALREDGQPAGPSDDPFATLERHSGTRWKNWDWDGVLHEIGADRWIDPETGEYVVGTLKEVVPLTASVSPRVGALRDRGIQRDEFAERYPGRRTVRVRVREDPT